MKKWFAFPLIILIIFILAVIIYLLYSGSKNSSIHTPSTNSNTDSEYPYPKAIESSNSDEKQKIDGPHYPGLVSGNPMISEDGRYVVFRTSAGNLTPRNDSGLEEMLIIDLRTGETEKVSGINKTLGGNDNNNTLFYNSGLPLISKDGQLAVFKSWAGNLVSGDTNGSSDIFVYDRTNSKTERISVSSSGEEGNGESFCPCSISEDGRYIVFSSIATNIVPDDTNGIKDVFVHDRQTSKTERISVSSEGGQAIVREIPLSNNSSSISGDGRYVAFSLNAVNLVPEDTNGVRDIFVRDREEDTTNRVNVSSKGGQANSHSGGSFISKDGRYVAFVSLADNLVPGDTNGIADIFVHDRETSKTVRVNVSSKGEQAMIDPNLLPLPYPYYGTSSNSPSLSSDGRYITYSSWASNLVTGDTNGWEDVFVYDRQTGRTERISVSDKEEQANGYSINPFISLDGRYTVFSSTATNLVPGNNDRTLSLYIRDRKAGRTKKLYEGVY